MRREQPVRHLRQGDVRHGIAQIINASEICGHNIIKYDLPVIKKLYGLEPKGKVRDSLVLSKLAYPEIKDVDYGLIEREAPGKLLGSYSSRLGVQVGEFKGSSRQTGRSGRRR